MVEKKEEYGDENEENDGDKDDDDTKSKGKCKVGQGTEQYRSTEVAIIRKGIKQIDPADSTAQKSKVK